MEINSDKIISLAEKLFLGSNDELLSYWENILKGNKELKQIKEHSNSLTVFLLILKIIEELDDQTKVNRLNSYKKEINDLLQKYIKNDLQQDKEKDDLINELIKEDFQEVGSSLLYHRIREIIGMNLFDFEDNIPTAIIKDKNTNHVAKILPNADENMVLKNGGVNQWEELMTQAITSMDDYTADTFDIISIMWMNSAKNKNDMIEFSHEDVLNFRKIEKSKGGKGALTFQLKQRYEVMKRLAALASIWISVDEDEDISLVENLEKNKNFRLSKFRRLFLVDNVTFTHDKNTDEPIGIYKCDIRPTEFLANFLYGNQRTTSFLSLKALEYNPVKYKYHKRLTRYFSWQWKMRSKKNNFEKPFNIGGEKGLLSVIGFQHNEKRPHRTKETFENILDKLTDDKVIGGWRYSEIDEEKMKNKGWYDDYWLSLKIIVNIPNLLINEFKKKKIIGKPSQLIDYNQIVEFGKTLHPEKEQKDSDNQQLTFILENQNIEINPEIILKTRKSLGLTITKAAAEIGIAHTTLSRYEKGLIKKPTEANDIKIKNWMMNIARQESI